MSDHAIATSDLYVAKLERRGPFSASSRAALRALPVHRVRFGGHQIIVEEGDRPTRCCFVETGLVNRSKTLGDGSRQIVSFHIPGDMVDLSSALVLVADHSIVTHTATTILTVDHGDILRISADFPEIARAFWFDTLADAAIFREWTVNVGRRDARARTAHLILEFAHRFRTIGMLNGKSFELPVTQSDLSDALGMTPVHLNRTLQWLRAEGYIRTRSRTMTIADWPAMTELAGFTNVYLHPEGPRALEPA